jgi:glucose-6-phosphate 1-epimerase
MSWTIIPGTNDLPKIVITHRSGSSAQIYLNGAQVTSWKTSDDVERLFLSPAARFENGKPIRGGIPVVFPQFADSGPLVKHGWLRTTRWEVDESVDRSENFVKLVTRDTDATRQAWDFRYEATLRVELEDSELTVTLELSNTGQSVMKFTSALHTYLAVSDMTQARVLGLYGSPYIDKTAGRAVTVDDDQALRITGETDRIYTGAPWRIEMTDNLLRLHISESGFSDVVVWNPWNAASRAIADMMPDDYLHFICIEAAIANVPCTLEPGRSWSGSQTLKAMS